MTQKMGATESGDRTHDHTVKSRALFRTELFRLHRGSRNYCIYTHTCLSCLLMPRSRIISSITYHMQFFASTSIHLPPPPRHGLHTLQPLLCDQAQASHRPSPGGAPSGSRGTGSSCCCSTDAIVVIVGDIVQIFCHPGDCSPILRVRSPNLHSFALCQPIVGVAV